MHFLVFPLSTQRSDHAYGPLADLAGFAIDLITVRPFGACLPFFPSSVCAGAEVTGLTHTLATFRYFSLATHTFAAALPSHPANDLHVRASKSLRANQT